MNNTDAVYKLINHFVALGYRDIRLIKSSIDTRNFQLREKAFCQVMKTIEIEVNEDFIIDIDSIFETSYTDFTATYSNRCVKARNRKDGIRHAATKVRQGVKPSAKKNTYRRTAYYS